MKRILSGLLVVILAVTLVACSKKELKVTFDTQGGSKVETQIVAKNKFAIEPNVPTHATLNFFGWFTNKEGKGEEFNFEHNVIKKDTKLYAVWTDEVVVRFRSRVAEQVNTLKLGHTGGEVTAPTQPNREGFRFGGWFTGKPGLTWLETEAVKFPLNTKKALTLYAYWEPINSKTASYTDGETYFSSITSDASLILNPLTTEYSHESDYMDLMSTPLYSTEVDWDLAIKQGVADYPADFSKIERKEFSVEALDYKYILVGATKYPTDAEGNEYLDENGNYDRDQATKIKKSEWVFHLNRDVKFEDGTPVTAKTWEFTLKQFLSKEQNNFRANLYYKTEENKNGFPILNAYEYYKGDVTWDEVGFEVIDDYTFALKTNEAISQSQAVGFGDMNLVHPDKFTKSLTADKTKSTYGTPESPFVSYGAYIIKTWDENQKLVLNKNYDYVLKGTINYKSQVIQVVDDIHQRMQLFDQGKLSVAGLNKDYYAKYNERPNVFSSWNGFPSNILINLAERTDKKEQSTIMFDARFRQALLYGFNRNYYATNVFAPNTPSLTVTPLDIKAYVQDPLFYSQSPDHLAVLEELGINSETNGFMQDRAKSLFNDAHAAWLAAGNTGAAQIELLSEDDDFSKSLANYIKTSYEELFGKDKLTINITYNTGQAFRKEIREWNFDITMNAVGFGSSAGVQWQFPAIAFLGDMIGGGSLGLSQPYDKSKVSEANPKGYADYYFEEVTIDLTPTYEFLMENPRQYYVDKELDGTLRLYDALQEKDGKAAGIYVGELNDIADIMINYDNPYDGTASEPFGGATQEVWKVVAAMEKVFFKHVPVIPTVTRSSATIYAPNVVVTWPEYHSGFGWGAARYRYLNTDKDFFG
ncbi:ABC transporter substrate-binding protein [Haploplasma modicum]|uniref:ABC transporter substrate-binding protein n=1 Tax=Haploplasma modicum TaxID=2150 RepID=UPI000479D8C2|nr:ABC transporter substrate-binding protein [Haploplasma modicum]